MKYYSRLNVYKNSTGSNIYYPETQEAFSYGWWRYLQNINGVLVFNNYSYSVTTSKHQSDLLSLLNYPKNLVMLSDPDGLRGIESVYSEIRRLKTQVSRKLVQIKAPRTHRKTNLNRLTSMEYKLKRVNYLLDKFEILDHNESRENVKLIKADINEAIQFLNGKIGVALYGA